MKKKTGLTSEAIWAMFAETKKLQKETAQLIKETAEQMKETDGRMKETDSKIFGIDKSIGFHAEQFFQDALAKSLTFGGIKYDKMEPNLHHKSGLDEIEFDIALLNGSSIAIIEVKSRVRKGFVKEFAIDRMKKFRDLFPEFKNHKAYLGIAAFSFSESILEKARECGIGIVKQVGNSIEMDAGKLRAY